MTPTGQVNGADGRQRTVPWSLVHGMDSRTRHRR